MTSEQLRLVESEAESPPTDNKPSPPDGFTPEDRVKCKRKKCRSEIWVKPEHRPFKRITCQKCGKAQRPGFRSAVSNWIARKCAWAALLLWPMAVFAPLVTVEYAINLEAGGNESAPSIFNGTVKLFQEGDWITGSLVGGFSFLGTFFKPLLILIFASAFGRWLHRHVEWLAELMEGILHFLTKWGLLDIIVVSLAIFLLKENQMLEFGKGFGFWMFMAMSGLIIAAGKMYRTPEHSTNE